MSDQALHHASCLRCKKTIASGALHIVVFTQALQRRLGLLLAEYFACSDCVCKIPPDSISRDDVHIFRATGPVVQGIHLALDTQHGERVCSLTFEDAVTYLRHEDLTNALAKSKARARATI